MIPALRDDFNRRFTSERYAAFLSGLDAAAGAHVEFRCSETPIFFPRELLERMARYGRELYQQLASNPDYRAASDAIIPDRFRVPDEAAHPLFVQADFGLVETSPGCYEPKLVEIQGFPSLYALQPLLAAEYRRAYALDAGLSPFLGGLEESTYFDLFSRAVLNGHRPGDVVLLEVDPYHQKTLADFLVTTRRLGIRIACITRLEKRGRKLYFEGRPVERIYNRVIVDELERRKIAPSFAFSDSLDVEWAGHPNWFFRLSKFSLPWLHHICVPETRFLSDVGPLPSNLDDYVLKPLFSFAGLGVKISPSRAEIESIPETDRINYILQEKVNFTPTIVTPAGLTKAEIRIMYIWDGELRPVTTIIRTGRGKMMGVDFNRNLEWVGASAGFYPCS